MAVISKINVNGTEYDIRSTIPTISIYNGNLDNVTLHEITKGIYEVGVYCENLAFGSESSKTFVFTNRGGDSYRIIGVEGYTINPNNIVKIFHGTTSVFDNSNNVKIGYTSEDHQTITFSNNAMENITSLSYYFKFTLYKKL